MPKPRTSVTVAEYAERRGVHVRTVHRWIAAGRIPAERMLPTKTGPFLIDAAAADEALDREAVA